MVTFTVNGIIGLKIFNAKAYILVYTNIFQFNKKHPYPKKKSAF